MKFKVVISAPYFQPVVKRFMPVFRKNKIAVVVPAVHERLNEKDLLKIITDIDGVIAGDDAFTEKVLKSAKKLKVISKWGTGIDSINLEACRKYNIVVRNTPNAFTEPVADSVLSYMLSFARQTPWMDKHMKKNIWKKIPGTTLGEKTLGIIGIGNIGRAVAKRAKAFGMRILANDIKLIDPQVVHLLGLEMVEKDVIYREADFITLCCDLNPTSRHLLNSSAFRKMGKHPVIINTSRGPVIKEKDLIEALKKGFLRGAGLDVFEEEPLPKKSPLLKMENVLLAPHNSNSSPRAWEFVHQNTVKNLLEELDKHAE